MFTDESKTLKEVDIEENDLFILLEHGFLPAENCIEVNVSVKLQDRQQFVMILNIKSTIKDVYTCPNCNFAVILGNPKSLNTLALTELVASSVYISMLIFLISMNFRTDITWDERGKLFANENLSLEKLGIGHGDCLWLEEGKIPSVFSIIFIFLKN